jgi:4-carboxymuconolactone decarboxylase
MSEESQYEAGMEVRRKVLGDEHVDRAVAATTDIDRDFQNWITENVWGGLWARDQLSRRDRSLVTIAILAAAGNDELELHLKAARNTGATPEEISEVLLHVAVYAGVPAANHALKTMKSVYEGDTR